MVTAAVDWGNDQQGLMQLLSVLVYSRVAYATLLSTAVVLIGMMSKSNTAALERLSLNSKQKAPTTALGEENMCEACRKTCVKSMHRLHTQGSKEGNDGYYNIMTAVVGSEVPACSREL